LRSSFSGLPPLFRGRHSDTTIGRRRITDRPSAF
jgi:hypothetical protein